LIFNGVRHHCNGSWVSLTQPFGKRVSHLPGQLFDAIENSRDLDSGPFAESARRWNA
jgi:hypothetical protein